MADQCTFSTFSLSGDFCMKLCIQRKQFLYLLKTLSWQSRNQYRSLVICNLKSCICFVMILYNADFGSKTPSWRNGSHWKRSLSSYSSRTCDVDSPWRLGWVYSTVDRYKAIQEVMDMHFIKKKVPDPLYCKSKDGTIVQVESDKQFDYYMRPEEVRFELSRTKKSKRKRIEKECWASTLMRATSWGSHQVVGEQLYSKLNPVELVCRNQLCIYLACIANMSVLASCWQRTCNYIWYVQYWFQCCNSAQISSSDLGLWCRPRSEILIFMNVRNHV